MKPGARLSWQFHYRRAEIGKIVSGPVGIIRSMDNNQGELVIFTEGQIISLSREERHRLVGIDGWGVVAEFWQHYDTSHPIDEDDIVRV